MRSEGDGTWSVCVCVCLSNCPLLLICHPGLQGGKRAIPTASVLHRHCLKWSVFPKDRAFFAYRGEVNHFCMPAYNYTRACTFYAQSLHMCVLLRAVYRLCENSSVYFDAHRAPRVPHFSAFILFSSNHIPSIFYPRRACAARVTVVVSCVCVCIRSSCFNVCLYLRSTTPTGFS